MKKRRSKVLAVLLTAGLGLSMFTACGKDDSSDKDSDKEAKQTAEEKNQDDGNSDDIAAKINNSSLEEITINGTSLKFIVDISATSDGQDLALSANCKVDLRVNPDIARANITIDANGETMDMEGYVFVDEDGTGYLQFKNEDGTYSKTALEQEDVDTFFASIPSSDTPLFTEETINSLSDMLKDFQSVGNTTVDGISYDTYETTVSEEEIKTYINLIESMIKEEFADEVNEYSDIIDTIVAEIPEGYGGVKISVYLDENGLPSGVGFDLTELVKAVSQDDSAKAVISVMIGYGDTSEISIPEATDITDLASVLE